MDDEKQAARHAARRRDPEQRAIEYYAAKRCRPMCDELTPSGRFTWAYWFQVRFGRTLQEALRELEPEFTRGRAA